MVENTLGFSNTSGTLVGVSEGNPLPISLPATAGTLVVSGVSGPLHSPLPPPSRHGLVTARQLYEDAFTMQAGTFNINADEDLTNQDINELLAEIARLYIKTELSHKALTNAQSEHNEAQNQLKQKKELLSKVLDRNIDNIMRVIRGDKPL